MQKQHRLTSPAAGEVDSACGRFNKADLNIHEPAPPRVTIEACRRL
jgi:hypothetical protein